MEQEQGRPASGAWSAQLGSSEQQALLLRADEVGRLIGLGRTKVYELIAAGELPVVRIGTAVRVPLGRLLWIDERTQG